MTLERTPLGADPRAPTYPFQGFATPMDCPSGAHFLYDRHNFLLHQRTERSLLVTPVSAIQETPGLRKQQPHLRN
jgi:hypothetical protein